MWFWKIMIRFFIAIDKNLFNFISTLYDLLIAISRSSVLSQGDIAQFATRVEILLGIFMLFKVSFSLITYIVNPDDFTDKQKGFGKLVQNSVISLTLLVLVPYIFQMAFSLQAKVLNDNILAKLLLGEKINLETSSTNTEQEGTNNATSSINTEQEGTNNATIIDTAGNQMAFYVMLPFFLPNYSISSLSACTKLYDGDQFNPDCQTALEGAFNGKNSQAATNYIYGVTYESLGLTFRADVALESDDNDRFYIDYKYPLSTATAVITCLLLITFCIDVGVRSVKLAFLQLVYPIPVISFMDPKSGKDGIFSKWYKMCLTTFLSLFIRLLALYFGIYVISRVGRHGIVDNINGSEITNGWVKLFVIIGILMFVKQLPKLLENLGIKLDGDGKFTLNPLKRAFDENNGMFGAKGIKRAGVAAGGAAMGLGMGAVGAATGAGIGRAFTGMFGGVASGLKGKKLGEIHKGQVDANQRMREARANGSTFFGRRGAQISSLIGSRGASGRYEREDKKLEESLKNSEAMHNNFDSAKSEINKALTSGKLNNSTWGKKYNDMKDNLEFLKSKRDSMKVEDFGSKTDFDKNLKDIISKISTAENDLNIYANKTAVGEIFDTYLKNPSIHDGDNGFDEGIKRSVDKYTGEAVAQGVAGMTTNYDSAKAYDSKVQDKIVSDNNERARIRESKAKTAADKSALGK